MSENFGCCPLCGGEKQSGTTTFAVDLKFGVVVVREGPALVCTKCGDAWIDDPGGEGGACSDQVIRGAQRLAATGIYRLHFSQDVCIAVTYVENPMSTAEKIYLEVRRLPESLAQEVLEYVGYLYAKYGF